MDPSKEDSTLEGLAELSDSPEAEPELDSKGVNEEAEVTVEFGGDCSVIVDAPLFAYVPEDA